MLTERVVDGRSDEAEIASPDLFDKIEDSLSASSTSSVSLPPITSPSSAQNDHFQNGKDVSSKVTIIHLIYRIAGNVCVELNFGIYNFDGILQTFLPLIFNFLTLARVHASRVKQSVSQSCLCCAISLEVRDCLLLGLCLR